jgi:hypothetical protein
MIIGLCGLAGSGKSVVAKALVRNYGYVRRPFAYPLKCMLGALGIPEEILDGPSSVKELPMERLGGKSVRYALQRLGTEWGRQMMGEDFWVKQWLATKPDYDLIVADDCRFPNEAAAIKALGGIIVRIQRDGAGSKVGAGHLSETSMGGISVDCILVNDGDLSELEAAVAKIVDVGKPYGTQAATAA